MSIPIFIFKSSPDIDPTEPNGAFFVYSGGDGDGIWNVSDSYGRYDALSGSFALRTPMTLTTHVGWILMATSTSSTAVWTFPTAIISPGTFSSNGDCHVDSFGDVIDFYYGINYSYGVFGFCATLSLSRHP